MNQQTTTGIVYLEMLEQKLIDSQRPAEVMAYLNQVYAAGYDEGLRVANANFGIPVIMCDLKGREIKRFDSSSDAMRAMKIDKSNIMKACRGKKYKTAGGYKWRLE